MTGLLRIRGAIELDQFWPQGLSDADTTKIKVSVAADSFSFASNGKTFKPTKVFANASIIGTGKALVIKNGKVTIRLQGIDAPELHYRASALKKDAKGVTAAKREVFNQLNAHERRQYWGETATIALHKRLAKFGKQVLPCEVYSFVDFPNEVADTYARIVGNIRVGKGFALDINQWLLTEGWVFPTFYSSMSEDEINACLAAAEKGRAKKRVWADYSKDAGKFNSKLLFRGAKAKPDPAGDKGPVLMPKIFRRQVAYQMQKKAGITKDRFDAFLAVTPDQCYQTKEFLNQGVNASTVYQFAKFFKGAKFALEPQQLVFKEKPSTIVNANGKKIEKF